MKNNLYLLGSVLVTLFLGINAASAQFTVTGTIKDDAGEPLIGASVLVKGTTVGEITDLDGKFSLNVPTSPATLVFSFIGFTSQEQEVTDQTGTVDIVLSSDVTNLEEVVVTGLATSVKRSNLANAVSTVSSEQLVGKTAQSTMDGALYGKLTGVNIVQNSGTPGGGMSVRLRGISSINGNQQPLYIIDGVYMDNSEIRNGSQNASGSNSNSEEQSSNRIADLDPSDIESIEVLKGSSAAAIYGSRANAGVVLITTKRGASGKSKISFGQDIGYQTIIKRLGMRNWDAALIEKEFGEDERKLFEANGGKLYDYEDEIYGNKGLLSNTTLSVTGGDDKTKFYIGGAIRKENGIIKGTGFGRRNLRTNVDHKISDRVNVGISFNFINTNSSRGVTGNENEGGLSYGYNLAFTRPWRNLYPTEGIYPNNPDYPGNPLFVREFVENTENVNRIIPGFKFSTDFIRNEETNLKLVANGGVDFYNLKTYVYVPADHQKQKGDQNGFIAEGNNNVFNSNYSVLGVFKKYLNGGSTQLTTQAGISYLYKHRNLILNTATQLIPGPPNIQNAGAKDNFQTLEEEAEFGYIFQQDGNFGDKLIASFGVRFDKSTLNGDQNKLYAYPKASLALNVSNFDFWTMEKFSQFKIRTAYGQTGSSPRFNSLYTSTTPTNIGGIPGIRVLANKGNSDLFPERAGEFEVGTDLGFFNNRLGMEFTYYNKKIQDLVIDRVLPLSSGFSTEIIQDAELTSSGLEVALNINPVNSDALNWVSNINFWKNQSIVTKLGVPSFVKAGSAFGLGLGTFYIEEGEPITQFKGNVNGETVTVGNAEPDFQMSFNNTLTFKKVIDFSFLFHWKKGGDNLNLSKYLTDIAKTTPDLDTQAGQDRLAMGFTPTRFIEPAGYVRLRELAAYYRMPSETVKNLLGNSFSGLKIGVSARNILTWTDYSWYDPEVSAKGGSGLSSGIDVTPYPTSKQFYFHLKVTL